MFTFFLFLFFLLALSLVFIKVLWCFICLFYILFISRSFKLIRILGWSIKNWKAYDFGQMKIKLLLVEYKHKLRDNVVVVMIQIYGVGSLWFKHYGLALNSFLYLVYVLVTSSNIFTLLLKRFHIENTCILRNQFLTTINMIFLVENIIKHMDTYQCENKTWSIYFNIKFIYIFKPH